MLPAWANVLPSLTYIRKIQAGDKNLHQLGIPRRTGSRPELSLRSEWERLGQVWGSPPRSSRRRGAAGRSGAQRGAAAHRPNIHSIPLPNIPLSLPLLGNIMPFKYWLSVSRAIINGVPQPSPPPVHSLFCSPNVNHQLHGRYTSGLNELDRLTAPICYSPGVSLLK